jgi:flagellar hook-associated protein 1 FlgK
MASSLFGILNTARSALVAHQYASRVVGHNISNATTEGYSRQRAEMVQATPVATPYGSLGTGVQVVDVTRARDTLLDASVRRESASAAEHRTRYELLGLVESSLGEPGDTGLAAALDAFWNAWSDLANDPSSIGARIAIRARGQALVDRFHHLSAVIDQTRDFAVSKIGAAVGELNELAQAIARLNERIIAAESGGTSAPDLRDERDRLLDRMASLVDIQVIERENGGIGVYVQGVSLVDGIHAGVVEVDSTAGRLTLHTAKGTGLPAPGGTLGALLGVVNDDLPARQAELDRLARAIVQHVNSLHAGGTNPQGQTGVAFFEDYGDPTLVSVTARTISLSTVVAADATAIAAGTAGPNGEYRPGANDVARALAQLRDTPETVHLGNRTIGDAYANWVSELGLAVASARDAATVHQTLAENAEARRASVSGVQTDEELVRLIQFQSAYAAAARVVTTADEMLQSLLNMV